MASLPKPITICHSNIPAFGTIEWGCFVWEGDGVCFGYGLLVSRVCLMMFSMVRTNILLMESAPNGWQW